LCMTFDITQEADDLFGVITKQQGIKHSKLFAQTQNLTTEERKAVIKLLITQQRVRADKKRPARGPAYTCYWPIADTAGRPVDSTPNQFSAALGAANELKRAKQDNHAKEMAELEQLIWRLGQLEASQAAPSEGLAA